MRKRASENHSYNKDSCVCGKKVSTYYTKGLEFQSNGVTFDVTGYKGMDREIVIPATYEGLAVTGIYCKFSKNWNLRKVVLGENVEMIYGFADCSNLIEIVMNKKLSKIYGEAFKNCVSLKEIYLPDTLEYIGSEAFDGCVNI